MVQIILPTLRLPAPSTTAEDRQPIVRWRTVRSGIGPYVPIGFRIGARRTAFRKPSVLAGRVAPYLIDDDFQTKRVSPRHDGIEIGKCPEAIIDRAIISDVVPDILHRRPIERRNPDRVDVKRRNVRQTFEQALEIAETVAVAVGKTRQVDLVYHRAPPPLAMNRRNHQTTIRYGDRTPTAPVVI